MSLGEWLIAAACLLIFMVLNVRLCLSHLCFPPAPIEFGLPVPMRL